MGLRANLLMAFAVAAGPDVAQAQTAVDLADSSVRAMLAAARQDVKHVAPVLRQVTRRQTSATLALLADSLTSRALIASQRRDYDQTLWTILTLSEAGAPVVPGSAGSPFEGALDRLIELHSRLDSSDNINRKSALSAIATVAPRPKAMDYLERVATTRDPTASVAMLLLTVEAAPIGESKRAQATEQRRAYDFLARLWAQVSDSVPYLPGRHGKPAVPDRAALRTLQAYVNQHGLRR